MPAKKNAKKSSQGGKASSKATSKVSTPQPPGTPLEALPPKKLGTVVVGINFGQTASSIALINKDGTADCIANDDGERQIPSVISFAGTQMYVGNPARQQLIRNQANTVVGFRNLLGKSYDEVKSIKPLYNSAAIVNKDGEPAYLIKPPSDDETNEVINEQLLTVADVTAKYLQTLLMYAEDFIGRKVDVAVFSTPDWFTTPQIEALRSIAENKLGLKVLQFLSEAAATAVASEIKVLPSSRYSLDSNLVALDVGGTSTTVTVLARRNGLFIPLATLNDLNLGGNHFEDQLMDYFVKEFNKKNKTDLNLSDEKNHKSLVKLRFATEVAKKTLSASNSANCSVDSLYEGYDFSGSINRMRCDLLLGKLYSKIMKLVVDTIEKSGLENEQIDEAILIGGSAKLPAITEKLIYTVHPNLRVESSIEPDEVVAIGCALQADITVKRYPLDSDKLQAEFQSSLDPSRLQVQCISKPLGLLVPANDSTSPDVKDGKRFITLLHSHTPLPFKKTFRVTSCKLGKATKVPFDLWQGEHTIVTEDKPKAEGNDSKEDDDDDESDEDGEPVRIPVVKPLCAVAHVDLNNTVEGDPINIVIKIENSTGTFLVSSGSGGENKVEAHFTLQ
ncbi:heat shock protein cognate 2 [Phakopsora pachyrhizi]|uniref:Heat shock protein cognate 2 n=1 Tax=Phakopsora pachyrhizi TaxID=170000 RepID=A0AAV0BJ05_PHAPC|nr:heat shock protein cognate 2 [Phakopsora pachyrhizi]